MRFLCFKLVLLLQLTQVSEAFSSSAYKNVMILNLAHNFITSINVSSSGTANHFDILDFSFNRLTEVTLHEHEFTLKIQTQSSL